MIEQPLRGGFVSGPVRVGDTVRKPPPRDAAFVRRLLDHFTRLEWSGAPRFLGADPQGRDMLSFIDGHVPWQHGRQPAEVRSVESLAGVARLVRRFHDLTEGTALAGDDEVVCHNDLSPKNTVYRDHGAGLRPVAFIDWDIAAPGRRVHDLAHVCWQYVGLGPDLPDAAEAGRLVRVVADAYGGDDRAELVDAILWWQERCWRGIEAAADAGEPAMICLRDQGAADEVRAAHEWTARNADVLRRALDVP
ncbi:hypothetical protein GCM10010399_54190 [Dactylosporangium fulvum]